MTKQRTWPCFTLILKLQPCVSGMIQAVSDWPDAVSRQHQPPSPGSLLPDQCHDGHVACHTTDVCHVLTERRWRRGIADLDGRRRYKKLEGALTSITPTRSNTSCLSCIVWCVTLRENYFLCFTIQGIWRWTLWRNLILNNCCNLWLSVWTQQEG